MTAPPIGDDRSRRRDRIAGGDYSAVDMAIHPLAHYLRRHGFDSAAHPALVRWRGDFASAVDASRNKTAMAEDLDRFFGRTTQVPAADFTALTR